MAGNSNSGRRLMLLPEHLTDEYLEKVKTLAAQGLSEKDIATCIGMSSPTFNKYKNEPGYEAFGEAVLEGQALGVANVTNHLMSQSASGSTNATKFYLMNRRPEQWQERKEISSTLRVVEIGIQGADEDDDLFDEDE